MTYTVSNQTHSRINNYLTNNSSKTNDIQADIKQLMNNPKEPQFLQNLNKLIDKHSLTPLFNYEITLKNPLGGLFRKLDTTYDLNRKITILNQLSDNIKNRTIFLNTKLNQLNTHVEKQISNLQKKYKDSQIDHYIYSQFSPTSKKLENINLIETNIKNCTYLIKIYDDAINKKNNNEYSSFFLKKPTIKYINDHKNRTKDLRKFLQFLEDTRQTYNTMDKELKILQKMNKEIQNEIK